MEREREVEVERLVKMRLEEKEFEENRMRIQRWELENENLEFLKKKEEERKKVVEERMEAAYKEVSNYQDLLLLGDLATISQEKRPYSWISGAPTLSPEAQTALTTSLLGLTLKLTGAKLANFKLKLPGGKMRARGRTEVLAYLALIQVSRMSHLFPNDFYIFLHPEHCGRDGGQQELEGRRQGLQAGQDARRHHQDCRRLLVDLRIVMISNFCHNYLPCH